MVIFYKFPVECDLAHLLKFNFFFLQFCSTIMSQPATGPLPPPPHQPGPHLPPLGYPAHHLPGHGPLTVPPSDQWSPSHAGSTGSGHSPSTGHHAPDTPSQLQDLDKPDPSGGLPMCAGCRLRITDKVVILGMRAKWHSHCFKCAECGCELAENHPTYFERDGQKFCKEDYLK